LKVAAFRIGLLNVKVNVGFSGLELLRPLSMTVKLPTPLPLGVGAIVATTIGVAGDE
jgi:hypothetical protein